MFDNIGRKIKTLATAITWIGIAASVTTGLVMIVASGGDLLAFGFTVAVVGSFASWAGSFLFYGFGQLIENTDTLIELQRCNNPRSHNYNQIEQNHYYTKDTYVRTEPSSSENSAALSPEENNDIYTESSDLEDSDTDSSEITPEEKRLAMISIVALVIVIFIAVMMYTVVNS